MPPHQSIINLRYCTLSAISCAGGHVRSVQIMCSSFFLPTSELFCMHAGWLAGRREQSLGWRAGRRFDSSKELLWSMTPRVCGWCLDGKKVRSGNDRATPLLPCFFHRELCDHFLWAARMDRSCARVCACLGLARWMMGLFGPRQHHIACSRNVGASGRVGEVHFSLRYAGLVVA